MSDGVPASLLGGPLIAVRRVRKDNKAIERSSAPHKADEEPSESANVHEKRGCESMEERPLVCSCPLMPLSVILLSGRDSSGLPYN